MSTPDHRQETSEQRRTVRLWKLSDAVAQEGYRLIVGDLTELSAGPHLPTVLGSPAGGVAVCEGNLIVCPDDSWDYAFSASHEIAEHRHGFAHTAEMFAEQANLLARWLKRATFLAEHLLVGAIPIRCGRDR